MMGGQQQTAPLWRGIKPGVPGSGADAEPDVGYQDILSSIVEGAAALVGASRAFVLYEEERRLLAQGARGESIALHGSSPIDLRAEAASDSGALLVPDIHLGMRYRGLARWLGEPDLRFFWAIPLPQLPGSRPGWLCLTHAKRRNPSTAMKRGTSLLAALAGYAQLSETALIPESLRPAGKVGAVLVRLTSGKLTAFNHMGCPHLGYSRREFSQLHLWDISAMTTRKDMLRWLGTKASSNGVRLIAPLLRHSDGSQRKTDVAYCVRQVAGHRCLLAVWLEEQHAPELQRTSADVDFMIAGVAHDLRAPVRHIGGFAQILAERESVRGDAESAPLIGRIVDAADQMSELIDGMVEHCTLAFQSPTLSEVPFQSLVAEEVAKLRSALEPRVIDWNLLPLPDLKADVWMLIRVLQNLLGNAVKYTAHIPHATIEVGPLRDAGGVGFYVKDNGAGFDMAKAEKLGNIGQRLHGSNEFSGTGIGLANVRRIIEKHGGCFWFDARPNRGATFYVTLPE